MLATLPMEPRRGARGQGHFYARFRLRQERSTTVFWTTRTASPSSPHPNRDSLRASSAVWVRRKAGQVSRVKQVHAGILTNIDPLPFLALCGSDGGRPEKIAERLANRGKLLGLSTAVSTMDSISFERFTKEKRVAFVTPTAWRLPLKIPWCIYHFQRS
jgi:sulfite reductase alpha subunit-like flavoprotein